MAYIPSSRDIRFDTAHTRPVRWMVPTAAAGCTKCGEKWPDGDPALQLDCPGCKTPAGQACRRPMSGNENVCFARDAQAERQMLLSACPSLGWTGRHSKPSQFVCAGVLALGAVPVRTSSPVSGPNR